MSETLRAPLEDAISLGEGEKRLYQAGAFEVLLCRVKGQFFAVENRCSHQQKPLVRGRLRGHRLICPVHGAAFDIRDGAHKSPPAMCGITTFPVIEENGGFAVEVPSQAPKPKLDPFSGPQITRTR